EHDRTILDVGKEGVLLGLVEAVDLVHEEERRRAARLLLQPRALDHLAHLLHSGRHGAERDEMAPALLRQQARQGRLSGPRRTPEDEGRKLAARNGAPEETPGLEEILLTHELLERARTHALRQRRPAGAALLVFGKEIEGIGHASLAPRLSGKELEDLDAHRDSRALRQARTAPPRCRSRPRPGSAFRPARRRSRSGRLLHRASSRRPWIPDR